MWVYKFTTLLYFQTFVDSVSAKVADITTTLTEADAASLAATNRLSDITSERANLLSAYSDVSVSSYKDATNKLDKLVGTDMKEYQSSGTCLLLALLNYSFVIHINIQSGNLLYFVIFQTLY